MHGLWNFDAEISTTRFLLILSLFLLSSCLYHEHPTSPQNNLIGHSLDKWSGQHFRGETEYTTAHEEGRWVIHAHSRGTASAIYQLQNIDLNETPFLNWSWRVNEFSHQSNQYTASGDDFSARIYVIHRRGLIPTQGLAVNFVWSNDDQLDSWPNPYSSQSMMVALQTRSVGAGNWQSEKVNIKDHFKAAFDMEVDEIHVIAIMSDSDNSGGSASASFTNLFFSKN